MNTVKYKLPTTKDWHYNRELDLDVSRFLVHDKARLYNASQYHMPKWQDTTITENFLFEKVMHNKRICKRLIEKILDITIQSIEFPEAEKSITIRRDSKSVRLDVYVTDDTGRVYDIEMQCTNPFDDELVKRTRYYQGMVDMDLIDKGMNYTELNSTYIIFICTFDLFGLGYPIYTFRNICLEDNTLELNDGTTKLFLNSTSVIPYESPDTFPCSNLDDDIFYFLQYINGHAPQGTFVNEINAEVSKVKESKEMEISYMKYAMEIERHRREAKNIGIAIGREEGLATGRKENSREIALSMLKKGLAIQLISECTSLSEQEILDLAKEHNLL